MLTGINQRVVGGEISDFEEQGMAGLEAEAAFLGSELELSPGEQKCQAGKFMRRSRSSKRGSERRESNRGSTLSNTSHSPRSR